MGRVGEGCREYFLLWKSIWVVTLILFFTRQACKQGSISQLFSTALWVGRDDDVGAGHVVERSTVFLSGQNRKDLAGV